jgi:hypothetical protein
LPNILESAAFDGLPQGTRYPSKAALVFANEVTCMAEHKTQLRTATSNREDGGARALAKCVKIALAFDAALSAGACALAACWGFALPAAGLALAFIVSAVTFAALREGGAA